LNVIRKSYIGRRDELEESPRQRKMGEINISKSKKNDKKPYEVDIRSSSGSSNNQSRIEGNVVDKKSRASSPTGSVVLAYLKKRGLGNAILELAKHLKDEGEVDSVGRKKKLKNNEKEGEEEIENEEMRMRDARTPLTRSTGGGMGYDLDSAPTIAAFGQFGVEKEEENMKWEEKRGAVEGKRYIEAFTSLLTWILSLSGNEEEIPKLPGVENVQDGISRNVLTKLHSIKTGPSRSKKSSGSSCKCELFSLSFPLFVNIYCELLEFGLQNDALAFLSAFSAVYSPFKKTEMLDLEKTQTTKEIVDMNTAISKILNA